MEVLLWLFLEEAYENENENGSEGSHYEKIAATF
jgi:hypothetical protein